MDNPIHKLLSLAYCTAQVNCRTEESYMQTPDMVIVKQRLDSIDDQSYTYQT